MNHEILLQTLEGKLHLAPLENPHKILDVGTGIYCPPTGESIATDSK